jgi:hypothetical protein
MKGGRPRSLPRRAVFVCVFGWGPGLGAVGGIFRFQDGGLARAVLGLVVGAAAGVPIGPATGILAWRHRPPRPPAGA